MKNNKGFTLIELLIVVAIIAILAAIAVPNFLEAQTRSKISRVKADQRSLSTAFAAYYTDNNFYPLCTTISPLTGINAPDAVRMKLSTDGNGNDVFDGYWPNLATTPVAYITSLPKDVFPTKVWDTTGLAGGPYDLNNAGVLRNFFVWVFPRGQGAVGASLVQADVKYMIVSPGPDQKMELGMEWNYDAINPALNANATYDPTNGTVSIGNVFRLGPQ